MTNGEKSEQIIHDTTKSFISRGLYFHSPCLFSLFLPLTSLVRHIFTNFFYPIPRGSDRTFYGNVRHFALGLVHMDHPDSNHVDRGIGDWVGSIPLKGHLALTPNSAPDHSESRESITQVPSSSRTLLLLLFLLRCHNPTKDRYLDAIPSPSFPVFYSVTSTA